MSDLDHIEDLQLGACRGYRLLANDGAAPVYGQLKRPPRKPSIAFRASTRGGKKAVTLPKVSIQHVDHRA